MAGLKGKADDLQSWRKTPHANWGGYTPTVIHVRRIPYLGILNPSVGLDMEVQNARSTECCDLLLND